MNKFKFEAFIKEFPFLRGICRVINPREIDSIKIRRADENLLQTIPTERYGYDLEEWEKIHFVMNGEIIQNAVARSGEDYQTGETWKGETILEALASLPDDPDNVKFIVREYYYNGWYGREYVIEVYKPPKGVKYSDLIARAKEKALAEVRAEADF